jgi:hypothetical protein
MKIRHLLRIQSEVEKRAVDSDLDSILNLTYYSKSKMQMLNIGDMHLTHFVRAFAKMLESNDSPIQNEINKMRERLDEIEQEKNNEHKH